ncbi:imm11 family protein [Formosa sp. PL04]|uniref:imm11 family protein n=1 Tax=Formosa sp. PL04 TaxID=3081755 RepID=UPI00298118F7|nr:DUF1629 domain-containing protein [Formosa sp. PL04]
MKQDPRFDDQAKTSDCGGLDPLDLIDGKLIDDPGEVMVKLSPRSGDSRGDIMDGVSTLFHDDFIEILSELGIDNIQYFPVDIQVPDDTIEEGYSLANIIGLLDAVDLDKSTIKPRAHGGIGTLYSFTIDKEKAKGLHIFRILHAPALIIVSGWLKEHLLANEVEEVVMYHTEEYDGWS